MSNDYSNVRAVARIGIRNLLDEPGVKLTRDVIKKEVEKAIRIYSLPDEDQEILVKELEAIFSTWIGIDRSLENNDNHVEWLPSKKGDIKWDFWDRYKNLLMDQGMAESTVLRLDEMTDRTLMKLENPTRTGSWDRRGLVVGHVQSGKTSNYIGLICKAADAGYRVIIVLAGMHNNLRSQTQIRLDEGFLGYDSATRAEGSSNNGKSTIKRIGVGKINPQLRADTITNRLEKGDFSRHVADHFAINPGGNPLLFVVKKNVSVLRNLLTWLEWASNATTADGKKMIPEVPLLLIDDECDFGSIDTKAEAIDEDGRPNPDHNPTRINEMIRRILMSFERRTYVGYSATPFANILIHEAAETDELGPDLFPRSFITCLPSPSNHVGPSTIFDISDGTENLSEVEQFPLIRTHVQDHADTESLKEKLGWMPPIHDKYHEPIYNGEREIPPSLRESIYSFILAASARKARGQTQPDKHNTMLIHVTRFQDVQAKLEDQVNMEVINIQRHLKREPIESNNEVLSILEELWKRDFEKVTKIIDKPDCPPTSWKNVEKQVNKVAFSLQVKVINGSSADVIDYKFGGPDPINVIVIGGDKLSRGLTLEGLTTSYFLRPSRMYDTLMQMGRWFGYRPGYLDLCRIYTRKDIQEWFYQITLADEELRREFEHMVAIKGLPIDYGLKVKHHPGLLVTSRVKMRNGTRLTVGYGGSLPGTLAFHRESEKIQSNYRAFTSLIKRLGDLGIVPTENHTVERSNGIKHGYKGGRVYFNAPADVVLSFIQDYENHKDNMVTDTGLLRTYIETMNEDGYLKNWTIYIPSGNGGKFKFPYGENNMVIRNWRTSIEIDERKNSNIYKIQGIVSSSEEQIDLDNNRYDAALADTIRDYQNGLIKKKEAPDEPEGINIRNCRNPKNALLIIYPIDPANDQDNESFNRIVPEWTPTEPDLVPTIGFAISFPGNKRDRPVEYVVNNVFLSQETGYDVIGA